MAINTKSHGLSLIRICSGKHLAHIFLPPFSVSAQKGKRLEVFSWCLKQTIVCCFIQLCKLNCMKFFFFLKLDPTDQGHWATFWVAVMKLCVEANFTPPMNLLKAVAESWGTLSSDMEHSRWELHREIIRNCKGNCRLLIIHSFPLSCVTCGCWKSADPQ